MDETVTTFTTISAGDEARLHAGGTYESVRFEGLSPHDAPLRDATFLDCVFIECDLTMARLDGATMRGVRVEASLERCDLRSVAFDGVDLTDAAFRGCDLRDADRRAARGYRIDPASNRVAGLRVALPEALSFLAALELRLDG